ncbi:MAG TPA: hypothetical protein VLL77_02345 [Anaerolineales bacterium]|nr:hypothetical protein [Anaerolineales bacterium]
MNVIYPIWLFFAAFFFYLAFVNWREAAVELRPFAIRNREGGPETEPALAEANKEFVREFNAYLSGVNKGNRGRHRAAAVGYALSGLIAMVSMFLMLTG